MKGVQREYNDIGGRTPWERHLRNQREKPRQWRAIDDPVTDEEIRMFAEQTGGALEESINLLCLQRWELSIILKTHNAGKKRKERAEYYAYLERLRDEVCVPAMYDRIAEIFLSVRQAVLKRLGERGIVLPITPTSSR